MVKFYKTDEDDDRRVRKHKKKLCCLIDPYIWAQKPNAVAKDAPVGICRNCYDILNLSYEANWYFNYSNV